jgi:mannitol-1-/sugar-/sorbitol-6-/2-deoxyglucose-6-phosphatase
VTRPVVIFDLDGVLVDSEPLWREGFRAALAVIAASLGTTAPELSDDDLRKYEGGRVPDTVATLAAAVLAGEVAPETLKAAVDRAIETASRLFAEHPRPITASVVAAHELHGRGFRLGVASSSAPAFIGAVLDRLELSEEVEAVESAFFLSNPKPHPDVYLNVMSSLGETPDHCLAVEDSWTGVQSSLGAGIRTVWLTAEPVDSLKAQVDGRFASDAESLGSPRPELLYVAELDADVVENFSEA